MESKTPPGSKPPAPNEPAPPEQPWISPRLREKLGEPDPGAPREGPSPWVGIVLAVLVIGGGAGLFVTMRSGAARQKVEAERVARERAAAAAAESTANVARIDSMRAAAKVVADSLAKLPAATASSGATPAGGAPKASATSAPAATAGGTAEPVAPKVVEKGPFGLDVGTFLAEDRANGELTRLAAATGLKGRVVPMSEDGGDVYHVVLGSFPTRAAADRRAESLLGRALVSQAQTIPLAP